MSTNFAALDHQAPTIVASIEEVVEVDAPCGAVSFRVHAFSRVWIEATEVRRKSAGLGRVPMRFRPELTWWHLSASYARLQEYS